LLELQCLVPDLAEGAFAGLRAAMQHGVTSTLVSQLQLQSIDPLPGSLRGLRSLPPPPLAIACDLLSLHRGFRWAASWSVAATGLGASAGLCVGVAACRAASRRIRRQGQATLCRVMQPFAIEPINPYMAEMKATAQVVVTHGRVVLDMSESSEELSQNLMQAGASGSGEAERAAWRELVVAGGLGDLCSGVVLDEEGLGQASLVSSLQEQGVPVGVRVDTGFFPLNGYGERGTEGLVTLKERCERYYGLGARFAKWRCKFMCSLEMPTDVSVWDETTALAECAQICHESGLALLLEIEFVSAGGSYSVERAAYVTEKVLSCAVRQLNEHNAALEAILILSSPCVAGPEAAPSRPDDVADFTTKAFRRTLPPALAGVLALPGEDMSLQEAARVVRSLQQAAAREPWPITPVYGPLILVPVMQVWAVDGAVAATAQLMRLLQASVDTQAGVLDNSEG